MRLHRHVGIEVIECAVRLLATVPTTFVHPLDLFITPPRSLVLLCAGNGNERVNLYRFALTSSLVWARHDHLRGRGSSADRVARPGSMAIPPQGALDPPRHCLAGESQASRSLIVSRLRRRGQGIGQSSQIAVSRSCSQTYLVGSLLRCRSRRLRIHGITRGQGGCSMLSVARPIRTRLSIHAASGVRVTVCHIWVRCIWRVLAVRVSWTGGCDGRIYR